MTPRLYNALPRWSASKCRQLAENQESLPEGVELVTAYDRPLLIDRAVANLGDKLVEEFNVVALVCNLFLWQLRSKRERTST